MTEDYEFISNVLALATNGTLAELLRRIEDDCVRDWKAATDPAKREECWHALNAIRALHDKIESLSNHEKVQNWVLRKSQRRL